MEKIDWSECFDIAAERAKRDVTSMFTAEPPETDSAEAAEAMGTSAAYEASRKADGWLTYAKSSLRDLINDEFGGLQMMNVKEFIRLGQRLEGAPVYDAEQEEDIRDTTRKLYRYMSEYLTSRGVDLVKGTGPSDRPQP